MKYDPPTGLCEAKGCSQPATEWHHTFEQTKIAKRLYGNLLHDKRVLQGLCYNHHHNKPVKHISEKEFCEKLGIKTRSKCGQL